MNITDYLVEYLKQGNQVNIPQVGLLAEKEVEAHFDQSSATFYPKQRTLSIEPSNQQESAFIQFLAQKECVSTGTATQIWKNYTDALSSKIKSDGRCMIGDLGELVYDDGAIHFNNAGTTKSDITMPAFAPVSGIKTYNTTDNDPFAAFEQPISDGIVHSSSMLSSSPKIYQPEQQPLPEPEPEPEPEPKPIPEPEPEPEPIPEPEPEPVQTAELEPEPAPQPEQIPESEKETAQEPEPKDNPNSESESNAQLSALQQLEAIDNSNTEPTTIQPKNKKDKKKGGFWKALLWIITILIVLLACAFVIDRYIFNCQGRDWLSQYLPIGPINNEQPDEVATPANNNTNYDREAARSNITDYTFSLDGIQFTDDEIRQGSDELLSSLSPFISKRLKAMKQSNNETMFMQQARQYIEQRLTQLLTDNEFHPQSLLKYDDYVREANMPMLKSKKMHSKATAIAEDFLSGDLIMNILSQINPDSTPVVDNKAETNNDNKKKSDYKTNNNHVAPQTKYATSSKQGFDIIAGYTANVDNAASLCSKLKKSGCDAYIINRNGGYYVSMGSASSRTEIEAKYIHIKEWYAGDMSIKKW